MSTIVNLVDFIFPSAGITHRYTNGNNDEKVFMNGKEEEYLSIPFNISDTNEASTDSQNPTLTINITPHCPMMTTYWHFREYPRIVVYEYNKDEDTITLQYNRYVDDIDTQILNGDHNTRLTIISKFERNTVVEIPTCTHSPFCNVELYSTLCGVRRSRYTTADLSISRVYGDTFAVPTSGLRVPAKTGLLDRSFFIGGVAISDTGQIIDIIPGGSSGRTLTTFRVEKQFIDPEKISTVKLRSGCDKSKETCADRYNNIRNNRSTPDIPQRDVYRTGIETRDNSKAGPLV